MNNDKYISVKDLENLHRLSIQNNNTGIDRFDIQALIEAAEPMVLVSDIESILRNRVKEDALDAIVKLISPQPEKFAGLTTEEWNLLNKHPYVYVECEDFNKKFLNNVTNYKSIRKLSPDPEGMTRTDINIPSGIDVEVTEKDGKKFSTITPLAPDYLNDFKHYRIIGIADSEVSGE